MAARPRRSPDARRRPVHDLASNGRAATVQVRIAGTQRRASAARPRAGSSPALAATVNYLLRLNPHARGACAAGVPPRRCRRMLGPVEARLSSARHGDARRAHHERLPRQLTAPALSERQRRRGSAASRRKWWCRLCQQPSTRQAAVPGPRTFATIPVAPPPPRPRRAGLLRLARAASSLASKQVSAAFGRLVGRSPPGRRRRGLRPRATPSIRGRRHRFVNEP